MDQIQQSVDQRYDYAPVVDDPADPMRGTVRGMFGLMTGERQRQVADARLQLEMEARRKQEEQKQRAFLLEANVEEAKFNRKYPNIEVPYADGSKINLRDLARHNPDMADQVLASEIERFNRFTQVKKAKDEADLQQAIAKIATAKTRIKEEESKQAGIFGLGGPNQKVIDEQKRIIDNESQTYGIPLGSEPEGAEPAPAEQTGAASTWLRSRLK